MRSLKLSNWHIFGITAVFFIVINLFLDFLTSTPAITFYHVLALFVVSTLGIIWNGWLGAYSIYKLQMVKGLVPSKEGNKNVFLFMLSRVYYVTCLLVSYVLLSAYLKIMRILSSLSHEELICYIIMLVSYIGFYFIIKRQNRYEDKNSTVINVCEAFTFVGTAVIAILIYVSVRFDIPVHLIDTTRLISNWSVAIITLIWCSFVGGFYYFLMFDTIKNWGNTDNLTTKLYHMGMSLVYTLTSWFILISMGQIQMINKIFHGNFLVYSMMIAFIFIAMKSWFDRIIPKTQES